MFLRKLARGGREVRRKGAGKGKGKAEEGTKRDKEVDGKRLVIKSLLGLRSQIMGNHTAILSFSCRKNWYISVAKNLLYSQHCRKTIKTQLVIFCTHYVHMLLFLSNSSFKNFHFPS